MHKSIMTKTKNSASEDWAVETTDEDSFKILSVIINRNNSIKMEIISSL